MLPGVPVVDDGVPVLAVWLNGVAACIGDGEGSGVSGVLLGGMPGVCSAMRRRRETRCMKPKPLHQTQAE